MAALDPIYAGDPDRDVRTCARCGQAALVCLNAWRQELNGVDTKRVTRE